MKKVYKIENLCCANCAQRIERFVSKIEGVTEASLSFIFQKLTVVSDREVTDEVLRICKKIEPDAKVTVIL